MKAIFWGHWFVVLDLPISISMTLLFPYYKLSHNRFHFPTPIFLIFHLIKSYIMYGNDVDMSVEESCKGGNTFGGCNSINPLRRLQLTHTFTRNVMLLRNTAFNYSFISLLDCTSSQRGWLVNKSDQYVLCYENRVVTSQSLISTHYIFC